MMTTSTNYISAESEFPESLLSRAGEVLTLEAPGLPEPHSAEADTFARHAGVPGHSQEALFDAGVVMVGAGGLNSWAALGLLRSGVRRLTVIDPDLVERTNLPRQFFFGNDLGKSKATKLAVNLQAHAIAGAQITSVAMRFEDAMQAFAFSADLFVVGVDRNDCRESASRLARARGIPAVFSMLSLDGMRCHVFLQGPRSDDPCLWCALPNLDPEKAMPCASAIISSCLLASSFVVFLAHRALMGWPVEAMAYNWREADLLGIAPDRTGKVNKRPGCRVCG